jgi:hypothetical protein
MIIWFVAFMMRLVFGFPRPQGSGLSIRTPGPESASCCSRPERVFLPYPVFLKEKAPAVTKKLLQIDWRESWAGDADAHRE